MIEYEKNIIMVPDNGHYCSEDAELEIEAACEKMELTFAGVPLSQNDFGFGIAQKIIFTKKDESEWTESERKYLDDEINSRLY